MRQVASILLCCVTVCAGAADIWRWRDANGVVHYSDNYRPGAERVTLNVTPPSGDAPLPEASAAGSDVSPAESTPTAPPVRYSSCVIQAPAHDEVFFGVQPVDVSVGIEPGLQEGHQVRVLYDGTPLANWPAQATRFSIAEVFRGSHTLAVRVLDGNGRTVCAGSAITFHLRQPSVLSPQRQPARPPATPAPAPGPRPPGG